MSDRHLALKNLESVLWQLLAFILAGKLPILLDKLPLFKSFVHHIKHSLQFYAIRKPRFSDACWLQFASINPAPICMMCGAVLRLKTNPRPTAAVPMLWQGPTSTSTSATPCPREVRAKLGIWAWEVPRDSHLWSRSRIHLWEKDWESPNKMCFVPDNGWHKAPIEDGLIQAISLKKGNGSWVWDLPHVISFMGLLDLDMRILSGWPCLVHPGKLGSGVLLAYWELVYKTGIFQWFLSYFHAQCISWEDGAPPWTSPWVTPRSCRNSLKLAWLKITTFGWIINHLLFSGRIVHYKVEEICFTVTIYLYLSIYIYTHTYSSLLII